MGSFSFLLYKGEIKGEGLATLTPRETEDEPKRVKRLLAV